MKLKLAWFAALAFMTLLVAAPLPARAQDNPRDRIVQSLELDQADIRDALKILFRFVGANYSVASDVQGTVTISLQNVPFETALRAVLNQVDATYRVEGGIYNIIKKPTEVISSPVDLGGGAGTAPQRESIPRRIKLRSADPYLILLLISQQALDPNVYLQPEVSTATGGGGTGGGFGGGFGGGQGGGGFGGGGFGGFGGGQSGGGFGGGGFGGGGQSFGGGGGGGRGGGR